MSPRRTSTCRRFPAPSSWPGTSAPLTAIPCSTTTRASSGCSAPWCGRGRDGNDRFHVSVTESLDLRSWGPLRPITDPDDPRSFCGPGGIVRHDGRWVLCLSSYPRPDVHEARCWTMASPDLQHWQEPRALRLKGPAVPVRDTGRALDPYLFRDKDDPARWWCCYKHGGVLLGRAHGLGFGGTPIPADSLLLQSMQLSYSRDLDHWTPFAQSDGEEELLRAGRRKPRTNTCWSTPRPTASASSAPPTW